MDKGEDKMLLHCKKKKKNLKGYLLCTESAQQPSWEESGQSDWVCGRV
jgi:hypothetical protein